MVEPEDYIKYLLSNKGYPITDKKEKLFEAFLKDPANLDAATTILTNQKILTNKYHIQNRLHDVMQQQVMIPNATVNKTYEAKLDFEKLGWTDFSFSELESLEEYGLQLDTTTYLISGIPSKSGDFKLKFRFRLNIEEEACELHEKPISFIVNPDPKSLWKNLESNKNDPYWKEDNVTAIGQLGDKNIVVASRRGRSHANVGSFRDDDFAFKHLEDSGWNVIVMSDGAGCAKMSRKGSEISCHAVIEYFEKNLRGDVLKEIDALVTDQHENNDDSVKKLNLFIYNTLGKAALYVHKKLEQFASANTAELRDLHNTLIFTLFKKYDFGYALLSFGVGDCPIGVLNKEQNEITLLNWLDVGEFGGGTRFITMPEIFKNEKFATRFSFKLMEDFSYLFLMTDGIYDPKFSVEANLEKAENWKEFIEDLQGNNADACKVEISKNNKDIEKQLASWMDFWSPGNHDDRTLAIIF